MRRFMVFSRPIIALLPCIAVGPAQAQPRPSDSPHLVSISAGSAHYCVLDDAGTIYCWGDGQWGQLGNGSTASSPDRAVRVASFQQFKQVVAGSTQTCALTTNGYPYCWGADASGVMGDATVREVCGGLPCSSVPMPVAIEGGMRFDSLSAGFEHVCGLAQGRAYCWGRADAGQLGSAGAMQTCEGVACSRTPRRVADSLLFSAISARGTHTCGIANASLVCWGDNRERQLLADPNVAFTAIPTRLLETDRIVQLSSGGAYSCAVTTQGGVVCWGTNRHGRMGVADADSPVGRTPAPSGTRFVEVSVGGTHTCAVTAGGEGYCWGLGIDGRLGGAANAGCGPLECSATPVRVELGEHLTHIAAGGSSSCATTATGRAYCWGQTRDRLVVVANQAAKK
jgi:alpha-tubulin suppressor-like RCC1 family protein